MKFYPVDQGSVSWYEARLGIPTASNFHRIVTPGGQPSKQADVYMYKLICERLLHETQDDEIGFVRWVARGKEMEPAAVSHFQFVNDVQLEPGGFVTTDDGRIGASPDRLFKGHHEALEVKVPAPHTHMGYLLDGLGDDHLIQLQGQILAGGFEGVHFVSWHAQMPFFHRVVLPDRGFQAVLASRLNAFCDLLDIKTERARALGAYAVARRVETPAEVAYSDDHVTLRLINPEEGGMGDASA
ncbi:MAG TPA: YqaJ viral recombinase family protein [Stellaceae bacterium]|nr:YqaJ viral recombinase family protein [Stellaceae bacterium]